jgi:hypothetical protein
MPHSGFSIYKKIPEDVPVTQRERIDAYVFLFDRILCFFYRNRFPHYTTTTIYIPQPQSPPLADDDHSEPGAKVAVTCESAGASQAADNSAVFGMTDEYGNFTIDLPSQLHATPNLDKACAVQVLELPKDSSCHSLHRSTTSTYGLGLSSQEDGIRAYTAGVIRLQHTDTPSDRCVNEESRSARR